MADAFRKLCALTVAPDRESKNENDGHDLFLPTDSYVYVRWTSVSHLCPASLDLKLLGLRLPSAVEATAAGTPP